MTTTSEVSALRTLINDIGIKQKAVSRSTDISESLLSMILKGRLQPSDDQLKRLAAYRLRLEASGLAS